MLYLRNPMRNDEGKWFPIIWLIRKLCELMQSINKSSNIKGIDGNHKRYELVMLTRINTKKGIR